MSSANRPRLIEDSTGRKKLKISLPGGRYQLSLDDSGVILLCDELGYDLRDTVPDAIVEILVATGDAWFPHQRDYESVIEDLPTTTPLSEADGSALAEYLRTRRVPEARISVVRDVVSRSPISDRVNPDDIEVKELPTLPSGIFDDGETGAVEPDRTASTGAARPTSSSTTGDDETPDSVPDLIDHLVSTTSASRDWIATRVERLVDREVPLEEAARVLERQFGEGPPSPDVFDVPGVGTIRGYNLLSAGLDSVEELAEIRPAELAETPNIDERTATTIVEGARELVGYDESSAAQLARQTNASADEFESALAQLAAAGVPPSAAMPTLRTLYGPSLVDVDGVDGRMAYFLWEAGYATPWELTQASVEELEAVDYLGPATAERVVENANDLINS